MNTRSLPAAAATTAAVLLGLTGCSPGTAEYGTGTRAIEAAPGEEFRISVPYDPGQGEWWYRVDPAPDSAVLRAGAEDGDDGAKTFAFEAVGTGRTQVRLLHCPARTCVGAGPTASPSPGVTAQHTATDSVPRYYTYTVTVR
ncbi:hypothetical protein ACIP98_01040 [Streptomyces sp. NPDC088354]|uniref:hypothetical protein n=1 Tax=Streptomyces sp. NPDC088354 TaxID=3365856 RepID=UPI00381509DB